MTRQVKVLNDSKQDLKEIRSYIKLNFGKNVWMEINREIDKILHQIQLNPEGGSLIQELGALGAGKFRQRLVRQTRIIYEYDDQEIVVHMFLSTKRDFKTLLIKRILSSDN